MFHCVFWEGEGEGALPCIPVPYLVEQDEMA